MKPLRVYSACLSGIAACVLLAAGPARADWAQSLQKARTCRQNQSWSAAFEHYEKAFQEARNPPGVSTAQMEAILWERAEAFDALAHEPIGPDTKKTFAQKAAVSWKEYLEWYDELGPEELKELGDPESNSTRNRICKVVLFMGQALVMAGEAEAVIERYVKIPCHRYLNDDAISLWKDCLYLRAGTTGARTAATRRRAILADAESWREFADFMAGWVSEFPLKAREQELYKRECAAILAEIARIDGE